MPSSRRIPDWVSTMAASHVRLGEAADVRHHDMEAFGTWWDATDSRDLRHLSRTGAEQATRQLWAMPGFSDEILAALDAADAAAGSASGGSSLDSKPRPSPGVSDPLP